MTTNAADPWGTGAPATSCESPGTSLPRADGRRGLDQVVGEPACFEGECDERAAVLVSRSCRSRLLPVCDRHAHTAVLEAERYGWPLVLQGLGTEASRAALAR